MSPEVCILEQTAREASVDEAYKRLSLVTISDAMREKLMGTNRLEIGENLNQFIWLKIEPIFSILS
ncbi:hypothetical protein [Larkinella terrae]|uniref:Uncharacterized protein n=1 Tax=Larkinella terrae TaxID=2025311 RepID=A0A7K0EV92_9BACT|nr:hypothetical protein [Larkinella terrae]MRS65348.1 hypothetical protein [Larkinella terrae]